MKKIDILLIAFLILLLVLGFFSLKYYKSEGSKCVSDPLGYAQEIIEVEDGYSYCSCEVFSPSGRTTYYSGYNLTP